MSSWFRALLEHRTASTAIWGLTAFFPETTKEPKSIRHPGLDVLEVVEHVFPQAAFVEPLLGAELCARCTAYYCTCMLLLISPNSS